MTTRTPLFSNPLNLPWAIEPAVPGTVVDCNGNHVAQVAWTPLQANPEMTKLVVDQMNKGAVHPMLAALNIGDVMRSPDGKAIAQRIVGLKVVEVETFIQTKPASDTSDDDGSSNIGSLQSIPTTLMLMQMGAIVVSAE